MKTPKFLLLATRSDNGMPMAMGIFNSREEAHDAMTEDYEERLAEISEEDLLGNECSETSASIHYEGRDAVPMLWSIVSMDEIERF